MLGGLVTHTFRFILLATTIVGTAATPVLGQTAAPAAPPASAPPAAAQPADGGEVLVVAERGPNVAIDRKSYTVKQGPAAEIADGMDVMRDLPSVTVNAAGTIELLGNANVKILIDGRPVPDALSVLRAMNAAQIQKVEVITNPSAQFPADGTAGIINVITKRSSRDGLGGTVSTGVDSQGSVLARVAPTWTQGRWTVSTSPTFFRQRQETRSEVERRQLTGIPDGVTSRDEDSVTKVRGTGFAQRTQVVYRPDQKRSWSAAIVTTRGRNRIAGDTDVVASDGAFAPYDQTLLQKGTFRVGHLSADYRAEGKKPGELLTVAGALARFNYDATAKFRETSSVGGLTRDLDVEAAIENVTGTLKLDYATPLGKTQRLSAGASADWSDRTLIDRTVGRGLLTPARNSFSRFGGGYSEYAAYATFQAQVGDWKLLPGLRVQSRSYSLDDLGGDGPSSTDLFPSLFVERKLSKTWTGVVSYSRRIAWADIGDLSPVLRYQSATFAMRGNPALGPETTDAFEARFSRVGKVHSFDLTAYHRITHDTFDRTIALLPGGLVVSSPINAGKRIDQGLDAGLRGRLSPSLRYNLTGNLTSVSRDVGLIGNRDRSTQYRGKLQLDYAQGKAADPGYDQLTFNLRYEGPVTNFQTKRSDFVDADLTWTHRFTPKLALVSSVFGLFGGVETVSKTRTPFLYERRLDEGQGRTVRLNLIYQLGDKPQPLPPQAPSAPSIPTG